jgi:hypothetical protein
MNITVRLGEPLWRAVETKELSLDLPTGSTVADLQHVHLTSQTSNTLRRCSLSMYGIPIV